MNLIKPIIVTAGVACHMNTLAKVREKQGRSSAGTLWLFVLLGKYQLMVAVKRDNSTWIMETNNSNNPPQFSVVRFPINYRERFSIVSIGTANPRREGSHSLGATTFNIVPQFIALSLIIKKMKRKDIKCRC